MMPTSKQHELDRTGAAANSQRWIFHAWWALGICIGFLPALCAPAQVPLPPDINLFGGKIPAMQDTGGESAPDAVPAKPGFGQVLTFIDGRQMHGELVRITGLEVDWRRPDAREVLRIPFSDLRQIAIVAPRTIPEGKDILPGRAALAAPEEAEKQAGPVPATIKLPGGDWLFGDLRTVHGQSFALRLDDGTIVNIPRAQLEWMYFAASPVPAFGYSGSALDLKGWLRSTLPITTSRGTVLSGGRQWIGRAVTAPARFELAFELPEETEEGSHLWLQPTSPRILSYSIGTAQLRLSKRGVSHTLMPGDGLNGQLEPFSEEAMKEKGPVRYRVFFDGAAQQVVVQRNGRTVGDWKYTRPDNPNLNPGLSGEIQIRGICFSRDSGDLRFNRLQIMPWNGKIPTEIDRAGGADRLIAGEAAPRAGKLETITDKDLRFSGKVEARQAGTLVRFSDVPSSLADAEVKLQLGNQGELNVRHLEIRDERLRCETSFAPKVELPLRALQTLLFASDPPKAADNSTTPPPKPVDVLVFKNGDEMCGHLLAAAGDGPVVWKTVFGQELHLQRDRMAGVRFESSLGAAATWPGATVELRNGERWCGKLVAFDEKQLQLEHNRFGVVNLERARLWRLYPNPRLQVIEGSLHPDEWIHRSSSNRREAPVETTVNANPWIYLDGTFVARGPEFPVYNAAEVAQLQHEISPDLERFEVRIDSAYCLASAGSFSFWIYADERAGPYLSASVFHGELSVYVRNPRETARGFRRVIPLEEKLGGSPARLAVRIFVDLKSGTTDLGMNGVMIAHLGRNPEERLPPAEYTVRFREFGNVKIPSVFSNLWVGPWNGDVPGVLRGAGALTALNNGDVAPGTPKALRAGKFSIESDLGPLEVPVESVVEVQFGGAPLPEQSAACLRLADGTAVNVDAFRWDGREWTAHSASLGDSHFPADLVAELIFRASTSEAGK